MLAFRYGLNICYHVGAAFGGVVYARVVFTKPHNLMQIPIQSMSCIGPYIFDPSRGAINRPLAPNERSAYESARP